MEEAVNYWDRALAGDPNNAAALAGLAVHLRSRQPDVALEYARRAVELSNWSALGPIRILSLVHRSRGEYAKAREVVRKGLARLPDEPALETELRLINAEEKEASKSPKPQAPSPKSQVQSK